VFEPDWSDRDEPGLCGRVSRIGAQAGAERLGATVYEIAPGSAGSPMHAHHANEEMIIVLSGSPLLRDPEGRRRLVVGEVVSCPSGRRGAHQLINDSDEPVRALVISTMIYPEVVEMLDSDKILAQSGPPGTDGRIAMAFPRSARVERLDGEPGHNT
jgi:uncharacterized cupin superfamily protein